jgi:uncharacterized protein YjbI with pentapeptide repeats
MYAGLAGAKLGSTDLREANLLHANLQHADLGGAKLQKARLYGANLKNAHLRDANLEGADLVGTDLRGVEFGSLGFQLAKPVPGPPRHLQGAENLGVEQLSTVQSLYAAELDPELKEAIQHAYPHLLLTRT